MAVAKRYSPWHVCAILRATFYMAVCTPVVLLALANDSSTIFFRQLFVANYFC
jgi:hypothetical protein